MPELTFLDKKICILLQLSLIDPAREYYVADLKAIWTGNQSACEAIENNPTASDACYATYGEQAQLILVIDRNSEW